MRRSRRASIRAGSSTTPPRPTLTKMQLAGRRSMVARSTRPAVCSVMGRLTTMASAWPASSVRRWGPWTSSTPSGGGPSVRRNPTVRMPRALPSRATSRPISPSPTRNRVWPDSSRSGVWTSGQTLARCCSTSRGSSLATTRSPRMANSARGLAWTPLEVVMATRSRASGGSPALRTCSPAPALVAWTQRSLGRPLTASARPSAESPGMPSSTSARSSRARQRASPSASRSKAGSPRWSAGQRAGGSRAGSYSTSALGSASWIRAASSASSGEAISTWVRVMAARASRSTEG